ncbi:MAG: murein L,D-transpeptidase [Labilibaculum antarcticum]
MKNTFLAMLSLFIILTFTAFDEGFEINEIIRNKIENQKSNPVRAENDLIYCEESLSKIYENRMFSLAWGNKSSIKQLIKSIEESEYEGLNPNDYHIKKLINLYNSYSKLNFEQKANLDLLATDAFLLYTSHLLYGKVNPTIADPQWHVERSEENPVLLFESAIQGNNIPLSVKEVLPKHKIYLGLKKALLIYKNFKKGGGWLEVPNGETLKKGDENDRIALVKKRLLVTKDLRENEFGDIRLFDDKLFDAVILFQKRHNIQVDGSIGKKTISEMNISVDDRIDQIKVNLERWRWLPQEFSNYYVKVNIADFALDVYKDGFIQRQHKVIVGKNNRKTPVFSSKISYLVLNPSWTVPPGIMSVDIIPAVKKDINYLKKKNLIVYDSQDSIIDPSSVDWDSSAAKSYTYRQPAGPVNALGAVKFIFPNNFSVYLHDTPSRGLFKKIERSFSSGCIRVQDPLLLAEFLVNDSINWNLDKIQKQVKSKKTLTIPLKEQPDIHILYWTAWTNEEGIIQFRNDFYDRDTAVSNALKAENQ